METQALQRELETKNEINARQRQQLQDQKQRIEYLEHQLELRTQDRLDVTADMSRQYKTMQSELISEVNRIENHSLEVTTKLEQLQHAFTDSRKTYTSEILQKDMMIEEQNIKMSYMTSEFENMLSVCWR